MRLALQSRLLDGVYYSVLQRVAHLESHQNRMLLRVCFLVVDRGCPAAAEHSSEAVRSVLNDVDQQEGQGKHEKSKQKNKALYDVLEFVEQQ